MGLLRFILAAAVVVAHTGPLFGVAASRMTGGQYAVQVFYVISGFYMQLVLSHKYAATSATKFWSLRAARLFPVYSVVWVASLAGSLLFNNRWAWRETTTTALTKALAAIANIALVGQDWLLFTEITQSGSLALTTRPFDAPVPAARLLLVPQAWTLGVELTFYLLAPFLLRWRTTWLVLLAAASFSARMIAFGLFGLTFDPWVYRFFPFELMFFLLGAVMSRGYEVVMPRWSIPRLVPAIGAGMIWVCVLGFEVIRFPTAYGLTAMLLIVIPLLPLLFKLTRDWAWDRTIGELSYPLYIVHVLVARAVSLGAGRMRSLESWLPELTLVASLVCAAALHYFVQRPVEAWRTKFAERGSKR